MPVNERSHRPLGPTPNAPCALILAAGRGQRLRPLTDTTPKPHLPVHGKPMIEWHLLALAAAGVREVVINTAWLEEQFPAALGDGSRWGLRITYSHEGRQWGGALETGGGVVTALQALALHDDQPFWLVSGDIVVPGFAFESGVAERFAHSADWGLLWMVPNPPFHTRGDFCLDEGGRLQRLSPPTAPGAAPVAPSGRAMTYASLALLKPALVQGLQPGQSAALAPSLFAAADAGRLAGRVWDGPWENVGTPEQWRALQSAP
ncbi:MAG: NDP-sugar synthase [Betaproteobacteria bacterium]